MNAYSVILRAQNNNGKVFDLEILDSPDFLLSISAIELGEIGTTFGNSSQTFSLPGSDTNNQFFNNVFDLGATPAVAFNKSVPCQVLVDGEQVFIGKLYISDVISDDYNNVLYNCVVFNETIDFRTLTENKFLADLNWSTYSHPYTYASVSQSWNDQLFSGSIFYPLINYGGDPLNPNSPGTEFGGARLQMDNPTTPLLVSQFKPAIKAKTIVDEIFNSIDYKYTSSFFNTDYFKSLYMLCTPDGKEGASFAQASGSYIYSNVTQSINSGFTTLAYTRLNFQQEVFNLGNNYSTGSQYYEADTTGNHIFNLNIPYNITSNAGPLVTNNAGRKILVRVYPSGSTAGNGLYTYTQFSKTSTSGVISTGDFGLNLTQGDKIQFNIALFTPPTNGIEKLSTIVTAGKNGVYVKASTPSNPVGGTVDISKIFPANMGQLDFMKGLIEKFNLVMEPVQGEKNFIRIEPFNDWVNQGVSVDWTSKLDRGVKYKVTHPINQMDRSIFFSDDIDKDVLNQYQLDNNRDKIYGSYKYTTDSDLTQGERQIGGFFAATPVKGVPVKQQNGTTVLPWLVTQEPGKYAEPYEFKPRLLHKTPIKTIPDNEMFGTVAYSGAPSGSTYYYIDDRVNSAIRALNFYRTLLPTTESPTIFSTSIDIHYSNIGYYPFQQNVVNGQCRDGLYNVFWAYYINSLYDIDARLLTCNIVLDPSDIKDIRLNNKYFIDGHYYRINKINSANLIERQSTEVELVKIIPRKIPYTGRRRIYTGMNPTDFEDVIVGDYTEDGNFTYNNFETGLLVTNPAVVGQAAGQDGFTSFGEFGNWNEIKVPVFNIKANILGDTKYDETFTNVSVVGDGNIISPNTNNTSIFGNDNNVNDAPDSVTIVGNSITVSETNNTTIIQPTGSRVVSGSIGNVIVNPIRDISVSYNSVRPNVVLGAVKTQGTKAVDYFQGTYGPSQTIQLSGSDGAYSYYNLTYSGSNGYTFVNLPDVTLIDGLRYQFQVNNTTAAKYFNLVPSGSQTIDGNPEKALTLTGSLYEVQVVSGSWKTILQPSAGGGTAGNTVIVQYNGTPVVTADTINFTGSGVSVTSAGSTAIVTIAGVSGSTAADLQGIYTTPQNYTASVTIANATNALMVGPTINLSGSIIIGSGSILTIIP